MFKALHRHTGEEIVILDPRWHRQIGHLRKLDEQDILVCQGCLQPVRVRAGIVKRWHFAHKHLQNCPYEFESPILLHSRAVLYEWLVGQLGEAVVTIEKQIGLHRAIDCWINSPTGDIGYWIIDARMPPGERQSLSTNLALTCTHPMWVFAAEMLHPDEDNLERLYLTTTEREFMRHTIYDESIQGIFTSPSSSLHYLDAGCEKLITFRNLQVHHPPQLFSGHRYANPISTVKIVPMTGEFIHPGEAERMERYHFAMLERAHQQQKTQQRITQKMADFIRNTREYQEPSAEANISTFHGEVKSGEAGNPKCVFCGQKTDDYWYLNRADNTCKCRACYRQGKY